MHRITFVNTTAAEAHLVVTGGANALAILGVPAGAHAENTGYALIDASHEIACYAGADVLAPLVPGPSLKATAA